MNMKPSAHHFSPATARAVNECDRLRAINTELVAELSNLLDNLNTKYAVIAEHQARTLLAKVQS